MRIKNYLYFALCFWAVFGLTGRAYAEDSCYVYILKAVAEGGPFDSPYSPGPYWGNRNHFEHPAWVWSGIRPTPQASTSYNQWYVKRWTGTTWQNAGNGANIYYLSYAALAPAADKLIGVGEYFSVNIHWSDGGPCSNSCEEYNLKIQGFDVTDSINLTAGQVAAFSATIAGNTENEIAWEIELVSQNPGIPNPGKISEGSSRKVEARWNGRAADGTLVEPGNYTAILRAWAVDDPNCQDTATVSLRVDWDANCNLLITFGSQANIASGNLSHRQPLFAAAGSAPAVDLTLYYNSLDPYTGVLGRGWSHGYELLLRELADGSVLIKKGNGDRKLYTATAEGYSSPRGDYSVLSKNDDGSFTLKQKEGTAYLFTPAGRFAAIEDRNGNTLSLAYEDGQLVAITDPAGRSTSFSYDALGKLAAVTDPAGRLYSFQIVDDLLLSMTYPDGHGWSYLYDDRELLIAKIDPLGATTQYHFDEQRRLVGASDPEGRSRSIAYAPLTAEPVKAAWVTEQDGQVWRYTYDSHQGLLLEKRDPLGGITRYLYGDQRNLLAETDPGGNTTYFSHDPAGNLLAITDPLDQTTRFSYNHFHQVTQVIDPEGRVTGYQYDSRGNLIAVTDPAGDVTQIAVDGRGFPSALTDPTDRTVTMNHDPAGNLLAVTDPDGATTRYQYDQLGRLIKQIGPGGESTTIVYDDRDNPVRITDPMGQAATAAYDPAGNLLSHTDPNGHTTSYQYDALGRMIKMTDAEGRFTLFAYGSGGCSSCSGNTADQLTSLTDPNGNTTRFSYDVLGRLRQETDPLGNITRYLYDPVGNLAERIDPDGAVIGYHHDALGRLLAKQYPDGTETTFSYNAQGRITRAANPEISYSFNYDVAGRITGVSDSRGWNLEYSYDAAGRRTGALTPDGRRVDYGYDPAGRLAEINDSGHTFGFRYDPAGRRAALVYPNGVKADYDYDPAGRLTGLVHRSGTAVIAAAVYDLDPVGNRLRLTGADQEIDYRYDRTHRLLEANPASPGGRPATPGQGQSRGQGRGMEQGGAPQGGPQQPEFYQYDPAGNRQASHRHDDYRHDPNNRLLSSDQDRYDYDANGNLISKVTAEGETSYRWDFANRLREVVMPDGTRVEFAYDPFGRRLEKRLVDPEGVETTTRYVYDHEDIVLETDANGHIGNRYLHGPGIDEPLALYQGREIYYYHTDGLGTITALSDQRARVVQSYQYDAFGNPAPGGGNRIKQPYRYTGREYDPEIGLYFYRARYYDPDIGRFISQAPIGFAGGDVNLYGYVLNNPVNWIDPMGLFQDGINAAGDFAGHSDFFGNDRFNYTKEDHGWSSPYNPLSTWRHFRDLGDVEKDLTKAIESRDKGAFERYIHQGQDYYSHYA